MNEGSLPLKQEIVFAGCLTVQVARAAARAEEVAGMMKALELGQMPLLAKTTTTD